MRTPTPSGQRGFTIVELIVVIVLIGILSAVALPRFISLTSDAHYAAVSGVRGALASGVALFRSLWTAKGNTGAVTDFADYTGAPTMDSNAAGYPIGTDGTLNDAADCVAIWDGILQSGAPTVGTGTTTDYQATFAAPTCTYTYLADTATTRTITYNTTTGAVGGNNPAP